MMGWLFLGGIILCIAGGVLDNVFDTFGAVLAAIGAILLIAWVVMFGVFYWNIVRVILIAILVVVVCAILISTHE